MAIQSGSRYQLSVVDYIQKVEDGPISAIVFYAADDLTNVRYNLHTYVEGETLHKLSWLYYGTPSLWWAILEYNPEITDFFNIAPGTVIRIPQHV